MERICTFPWREERVLRAGERGGWRCRYELQSRLWSWRVEGWAG